MDGGLEKVILLLLSAWCFAALTLKIGTVGMLGGIDSVDVFARGDFRLFILLFVLSALCCLIVCNVTERRGKTERTAVLLRLLCIGFGGYCAVTLPVCADLYFWLVLCGLWAVLSVYALRRRGDQPFLPSRRKARVFIAVTVLTFIAVVGGTGALRYLTFRAPNFDFGIFAQMFEGMKRTGLPVTTCERDRLLSHFAVHLSPVLYLLLPIYWLFPSPVTLQLSQAVILASAVAPMTLLCRRYGFGPERTALFAVIVLFHPAVTSGTNYDFHENCFLLPLLLWLFYWFERGKPLPVILFSLAVLAVKEDAAVYIAFFALFVLLDRKKYAAGAGLLALALVWFLSSLKILTVCGEGVMTNRYDNYIAAGGGLWEAVQNALRSPAYVLTQLLAENSGGHEGKLLFCLQMLVPLGFLPLTAKRPSRLLLLLPAVLVNLMTLYVYQYDIGFQYSFGSAAFLLYAALLNGADLPPGTARTAVVCAAVFCGLFTLQNTLPRAADYARYYAAYRTELAVTEAYLASLPREASVACSTWLVAHLASHETLYETYYHDPAREKTDVVIFDASVGEEEISPYTAAGYVPRFTVTAGDTVLLRVYALPDDCSAE